MEENSAEVMTAAEYAGKVREWIAQAYHWHYVSYCIPFMVMQQSTQAAPTSPTPTLRPLPGRHDQEHNVFQHGNPRDREGRQERREATVGAEFKIPSLLKRLGAEMIDFTLLFVVKFAVTLLAADFADLIDTGKYSPDLLDPESSLDYDTAMQITADIVTLELLHRIVVCVFETLCLHRGAQTPGGTTPGKSLFRLRVVSCERITTIAENRVLVYPAGDLGLTKALERALLKNFGSTLFFPIGFLLFFFQHNRAIYDILCGCVVVEDIERPRNRL